MKLLVSGYKEEKEEETPIDHDHVEPQERDENSSDDKYSDSEEEVANPVAHNEAEIEECQDEFVDAIEEVSDAVESIALEKIKSDDVFDICSIASVSTAATIEPHVIRAKVKKILDNRNKVSTRRRCIAKGEASAITRKRKENRDVIREYNNSSSIWE